MTTRREQRQKALYSVNELHPFFEITPVRRSDHALFNLLEFRFFRNSEHGVALPFGNSGFLSHLLYVPYVVVAEVIFFRSRRCFVKLRQDVVGVFAFHEKPDSLFVGSLGVAEKYRRIGIASFILKYVERLASRMRKDWLELSVLKRNTPAQQLYTRFGFTVKMERKWSFVLKKKMNWHEPE